METETRIVVDGEVFLVTRRRQPIGNRYDFSWVEGRHAGDHGFSSMTIGGPVMTEVEMRSAVIDFLAEVDPETGFLD